MTMAQMDLYLTCVDRDLRSDTRRLIMATTFPHMEKKEDRKRVMKQLEN